MQVAFLSLYSQIQKKQLSAITGLWLLHGDEPLIQNWFIKACRPLFTDNAQTVKRVDVSSLADWRSVVAELDSLSLFCDNLALIITGKPTTDEHILAELARFAQAVGDGDSDHCLIYELPKQGKKEQNSKLFKTFDHYGTVVDCQLYDEQLRFDLLRLKACEFGLSLTKQAWHFLMAHTEHNLLAGHQALWRASDLHTDKNQPIDTDKLTQALVCDYHYSPFNLSDMLLMGDTQKALQILYHLKQTDTAPSSILWAIAKDIRLVLSLKHTSAQSLGIWQSKIGLYQNALMRHGIQTEHLTTLYEIDACIKGIGAGDAKSFDVWELIEQLCIDITAGVHIKNLANHQDALS